MTLLLVFVAAVFTIFALWRMVAPFLGDKSDALHFEYFDEAMREVELLNGRRTVLLTALRELDFERETGKLAADDYQRFHRRYEREAVQIMRRLDELHGGKGWQDRVNAQLEERLGHRSALSDVEASDEPPESVETPEQSTPLVADDASEGSNDVERSESDAQDNGADDDPSESTTTSDHNATTSCSGCGDPLEVDDRFCSQCGTPVVAVSPQKTPSASEVSA